MGKNILLFVSGMTPQIITETIWALACDPNNDEKWIPSEIRVVTTINGVDAIKKGLFDSQQRFQQLVADYNLPKIKFGADCLIVINDDKNEKLNDLKSPKDNECAADKICSEIQKLTADDNVCLHVSIAGGRKTMGFYAGYALSLYGRVQDRMSHVLVSSEFESLQGFYYPAAEPNTRHVRKLIRKIENNQEISEEVILDTFNAKVWLANIPFVRLRGSLPKSSLLNEATFSDVVKSINLANHPQVIIHPTEKMISVDSLNCVLPAREFAFYWWIVQNHLQNKTNVIAPKKEFTANPNTKNDYPELIVLAENYLSYYKRLKDEMSSDAVQHTLRNGMERTFFDERVSNIKKRFKNSFGEDITKKICIHNLGRVKDKYVNNGFGELSSVNSRKPAGTYGLTLDKDQIMVIE